MDCAANGASSAHTRGRTGPERAWAMPMKSKTGCMPSRPIDEPQVAVAAAASGVAMRHPVREPAALERAAPPFACLEADVPA